ncbi:MAG: nucleotidyltransferase domain-containing protein [Muribaculaceae bacterium]|nr:nucleotidyltransferase domain-containing protein [Muribaculaceae bacterium]
MTTKSLISCLKDYFDTQPVEKAWLFGSFSRGEQTEESDVDIIVRFKNGMKIGLSYFKMIDELERICSRKVDLAEEDSIDHYAAPIINKEKILIYERATEVG